MQTPFYKTVSRLFSADNHYKRLLSRAFVTSNFGPGVGPNDTRRTASASGLSEYRLSGRSSSGPAAGTPSMGEGIRAALIDLSGTLHIEDAAIPGAPQALKRLRESGLKVKFVTNTTKESMRLLHQKVTSVGFSLERDEIFTSLTAARKLVESKNVRPFLLLEECAKEDFAGISEENPNAVVVGLAPTCFDYAHMNKAFRMLLDGAPLIAIHKGRYYQKKDGLYLGPGPFVSGLEYATEVKAEVVGKPESGFFHAAVRDLGVDPKNTVMIGDDVRDDVGGALAAGMKAILVKTGKYREGDESKISPPATAVCEHFPAAVDYILANLSS